MLSQKPLTWSFNVTSCGLSYSSFQPGAFLPARPSAQNRGNFLGLLLRSWRTHRLMPGKSENFRVNYGGQDRQAVRLWLSILAVRDACRQSLGEISGSNG